MSTDPLKIPPGVRVIRRRSVKRPGESVAFSDKRKIALTAASLKFTGPKKKAEASGDEPTKSKVKPTEKVEPTGKGK